MCIDYGKKRMGIALSDPTGTIAYPLEVVDLKSMEDLLERVGKIIEEHCVTELVVGLPLSLSGKIGESATEVLDFVVLLKESFDGLKIETWDERLSTAFAEKEMIRDNVRRKKRRGVIDKLAATVILQSYLDSGASDGPVE